MKNAQSTPKLGNAEILGTPTPPKQTGAYFPYVTARKGGSDKVIRGMAHNRSGQFHAPSPTERNVQNRDVPIKNKEGPPEQTGTYF